MGAVIHPVLSIARTEGGRLVVWYDRTINSLLRRAKMMEVKR